MTLYKQKYRIESARLKGWDYRNPGYYFVTICTKDRAHYFGYISDSQMHLSAAGEIAAQCWREIPIHHPNVELDEFMVMPNHLHGILVIREHIAALPGGVPVETLHATSLQSTTSIPSATFPQREIQKSVISPKAGSLSVIIRSYKSAVTKSSGLNDFKEFAWQTRFYDTIIRDEKSFHKIRQYISDNPVKWELDKNNPSNLLI